MIEDPSKIADWLNEKFANVSFDSPEGHTLSDKSYGFDTMFFMSRFIDHFRFGNVFKKSEWKEYAKEYTSYLFMLDKDASQVLNYLTETLSVLCFTGVLHKRKSHSEYEIIDDDLLHFVSSSFENAYIFNYMLVYNLYKKYNWLDLYKNFCTTSTNKGEYLKKLRYGMELVNPSFNTVNKPQSSNYPMFVTKQHIEILNFINNQNHVARTGNIKDDLTTIEDIALNVNGTRKNFDISKKNNYLYTFSSDYVKMVLQNYLFINIDIPTTHNYSPSLAVDIADGKLELFDGRDNIVRKRKENDSKYKISSSGLVRTVQGEFRNGLFQHTPHVCPVCGFSFADFLIASHIIPYSKCEDTYDAMNYNNGLLMCPVCDKLFESAKYMTIKATTGEVLSIPKVTNNKYTKYVSGVTIKHDYIDGERRHYLKWHNELFCHNHNTKI